MLFPLEFQTWYLHSWIDLLFIFIVKSIGQLKLLETIVQIISKILFVVFRVETGIMYQSNDANISFNIFSDIFNSIYCDCFPMVSVRYKRKRKQVWITSGMFVSIKRKTKLHNQFLRSPTKGNKEIYRQYRIKLNHVMRILQNENIIMIRLYSKAKNDSKRMWTHINPT